MVTTGIIQLLWSFAEPLISRMPDIAINYDGIANSSVYQFIRAGLYFLPMDTVVRILSLVIALWVVRLVIAFLHSIWAALPIV